MTSPDERIKMAVELRDYANAIGSRIDDANVVEAILLGTIRHRDDDGTLSLPTSHASLIAMLADLIDPTCEAVYSATSADDELVCSECGATLGAEIDGRQAFVRNFCPCCGARVMRDSA